MGNRDAGIREAECEKAAMDVKYNTDTKIEDNSRAFKLQKANFDKEVNSAKAEAQLAYELQAAKIQQKIRNEEIQIQVVERRKQIEIEEQEIKRKEKELTATVKLPAEVEAFKVQTVAEGNRTRVVETAKAEGEKIKLIGLQAVRRCCRDVLGPGGSAGHCCRGGCSSGQDRGDCSYWRQQQ